MSYVSKPESSEHGWYVQVGSMEHLFDTLQAAEQFYESQSGLSLINHDNLAPENWPGYDKRRVIK